MPSSRGPTAATTAFRCHPTASRAGSGTRSRAGRRGLCHAGLPLPRGTEQPSKQKGNGLDVSERHLGFDTFDLVEQMLVSHHFTRDGDDDGR